MITEIAEFKVSPDRTDEFSTALTGAAISLLSKSQGYRSHRILICQETPGRVVLTVDWDTLEDHTVGFRQSPAFIQWRAIIGPYFLDPPKVEHFNVVAGV